MTPHELISDLRALGPGQDTPAAQLYTRLLLRYLADHLYDAELTTGMKLRDLSDVIAFLRETADAARIPQSTKVLCAGERGTRPAVTEKRPPAPQPRWDATCPLCGHIHGGDAECGMPIGGGRVCRCEFDGVPA